MDVIKHLQRRLQGLADQMATLDNEIETLEGMRIQVTALYRATKVVLDAELKARGLDSAEDETSWAAIRTMTLKDAIYTIVGAQGEEGIHVNHIFERLKDAGFPLKSKTPKKSIVSTIYHNHATYTKVAPNTFRVVGTEEAPIQAELVHVEKD